MLRISMFEKLEKRTQEWLISSVEHWTDALLEKALGEFADTKQAINERLAIRLNFSRPFDMGLFVEGEKADEALGFLITQIKKQSGKNLRNPSLRQLNCLIANVYKQNKRDSRLWTRLKLRNKKAIPERYNPLGVSPETLRNLINYLRQLEYIHFVRGNNVREDKTYDSHSPRIVADNKLIELLEGQFNWDTSLLRYHETDEVIIMRSKKDAEGKRRLVDYADTDDTCHQRDVLNRYNQFLLRQKIQQFDEWGPFFDLIRTRRSFNDEDWTSGGRLWGGEYQQKSESNRSKTLINDEPVMEVDIKSCHATMAFASIGIDWYGKTDQDIYENGLLDAWPRNVVKRAFNIMLNAKNSRSAMSSLYSEQRKTFLLEEGNIGPFKGWGKKLVRDLERAYPELQSVFYKQVSNKFMNKEGKICLEVIEQCMDQQIVVLTVHDSFICQKRHEGTVRKILSETFKRVVGAKCIIE